MQSRLLFLRYFAGVLVVTGLVGCGGGPSKPARAPVSGKVVTKGGKDCDGALVVFHASAQGRATDAKPVGTTGADGAFALTSFETNDGAIPGDYCVTIVWPASTKSAKISLSSEILPNPVASYIAQVGRYPRPTHGWKNDTKAKPIK